MPWGSHGTRVPALVQTWQLFLQVLGQQENERGATAFCYVLNRTWIFLEGRWVDVGPSMYQQFMILGSRQLILGSPWCLEAP